MTTQNSETQIVESFASLVRQYSAVIDEAPKLDRAEILARIYPLLPRLIAEAIALPKIEGDEAADDTRLRRRPPEEVPLDP